MCDDCALSFIQDLMRVTGSNFPTLSKTSALSADGGAPLGTFSPFDSALWDKFSPFHPFLSEK